MGFKDKVSSVLKDINSLNTNDTLKKFKEWKYFKITVILSLVVLLFIGFNLVNINTTKNEVLRKLERALYKADERQILKIIYSPNKYMKLSKKEIEPLIRFYQEDKSRVKTLIEALNKDKEQYCLRVIKENRLLRDRYYIDVNMVDVEFTSNFEGSSLYLNDKLIGVTDNNGKVILNDIVPGVHNVKIENNSEYSMLSEEKDILIMSDSKLNVLLDGIKISVTSNFVDGYVYVNGKNSRIKVNDFKNIGPFKNDGSVELVIKAETPWGEISSDSVYIKDYPEIEINIDLKKSGAIEDIKNTVMGFYESVFSSLNSQDKNNILNATDEVKNDMYNILNKKYFIFKNTYSIENLEINIDNSEILFENMDYTGNIVVNISYSIKKNILGLNFKTENYGDSFFTNIKYIDGKWVVYRVDNFSLKGVE